MKLIIIFGPPAVGKMTVGKALSRLTNLKLFHNHMSIELVRNFFDFGHPQFRKLDKEIRFAIFQEVAKSDVEGLIFTFVWAIDHSTDRDYIDSIIRIFEKEKSEIYFVELKASLSARLERNRGEDRLAEKASKRDLKRSEENLLETEEKYRLNTEAGDLTDLSILKIDNTELSAEVVARKIKEFYQL